MKHLSFDITDNKAYKKAIKESSKTKYKSKLIQLFCGFTDTKKIKQIIQTLKKDFKDTTIIGATTAGEIVHTKMQENSCAISLSLFENTKIQAIYSKNIDAKSGKKIAKKICNKQTKAAIVLSEGLKNYKYEAFLNGIKSITPNIIISGGLAGDNFELKKTFVFLDENIYQKGGVIVSFSSKRLFAQNRYNLSWIPIGKEFEITDAKDNVIFEIDKIKAVDFFKKYLGDEVLAYGNVILSNFQLLFKEGKTTVARTPLAIDGSSIVLAAPIKKHQKVQFGFSNKSIILDGAYKIKNIMSRHPAQAIYIYSCIARKTLLGKILEKEFKSFEELAPCSGFFTYGEFYSSDKKDVLLNCTTTILALSESKKVKKTKTKQIDTKTLDSITFDALSHFIKQTSIELKASSQLMNQYKDVVDTSFLVSKTDRYGNITYANDEFCKVSKYTQKELLGKNHNIVRDPNIGDGIFKRLWQTITSGKVWKGMLSNRAKDGSIYYVNSAIMPIFDENNKIKEYIAVRQNITKQVKANQKVLKKEKLIRAIFDNQDSIVIYASKTKGMQSVNKKFFEYFDFANFNDFKSKHSCICDLFLEKEGYINTKTNPNWLEEIANSNSDEHKVKMEAKTGKIHTFNIKIKKIDNEYIINLYDITNLEEALLRAYSSEKAKATFLANMSHEIRTPLNGILGFTDILTKKNLEHDVKKYINIIHSSGQTLLNIVNDILDFSKIESGELSLHVEPTNLFEELEATVSTFASVSRAKQINYYTFIDTNIPKLLKCDSQRLKQVLNNLINNAIKFTPQDGTVFVDIKLKKTDNEKATIHFSVKDTGIGISKDKIGTIFQAFSQADNSISKKFGGTGLGLSISNQYIEMMNSKIEVKSEEGKGSEFFFEVEFEIVDNHSSVEKIDINNLNIAIMNSHNNIACGLNNTINAYLDSWGCECSKVDGLEKIDENLDVIVICAKFFDDDTCINLLKRYPKLHIICIEEFEEVFGCNSDRFHIIEQPITGSALFDKFISLVGATTDIQKNATPKISQSKYKGKILVAEDNETNQMLISILLQERGLQVKIVNNGQEAIDELKNNEYDLTFMDINMPLLDGISATKQLRDDGYGGIIVSLSANVIESDTQSFREAGVDDILKKPIVPDELDEILSKFLTKDTKKSDMDVFDIDTISKELNITNKDIVKKLLSSFLNTLKEIKEQLQTDKIDKEISHKLKGASGNMRFKKMYELLDKIENNIDTMKMDEKQKLQKEVLLHVENAIKQLEEIL